MTLRHCNVCFLTTDKFSKENRPVNTWLSGVFVFALTEYFFFFFFFNQDFILEHYSEDGSNFQDEIDDLMDLRLVWCNMFDSLFI